MPSVGEVHVSYADTRADTNGLAAALELLSPDERKRAEDLRDRRRREQFVNGRAQCRRTLSTYAAVGPKEWRFALGDRGKPAIAAPVLEIPLWFSLSHAESASVCAVTTIGPGIGVDLEPLDSAREEELLVAEQFFPAAEAEALRQLPKAQRDQAFVQHWALKESLAKAAQCSLADALAGSEFAVDQSGQITVRLNGAVFGPSEDWHFCLFRPSISEIGAVALSALASHEG